MQEARSHLLKKDKANNSDESESREKQKTSEVTDEGEVTLDDYHALAAENQKLNERLGKLEEKMQSLSKENEEKQEEDNKTIKGSKKKTKGSKKMDDREEDTAVAREDDTVAS
ncbi:hypothetical protein [Virgibacillus dakarensis]|nr:hypothetical protein [Virgibacillus dakarensis]